MMMIDGRPSEHYMQNMVRYRMLPETGLVHADTEEEFKADYDRMIEEGWTPVDSRHHSLTFIWQQFTREVDPALTGEK